MTATIIIRKTILEYALYYATEMSWAVFPLHSIDESGRCTCGKPDCESPGKHPRTRRGVLDASKDETKIRAWFGDLAPLSNIGIATGRISNLIVLDEDAAKGGNRYELEEENVFLFDTTSVESGGGFHFYYEYPPDMNIKNSASRLGKFIDVRGDGGYVVAPPSIHVSGAIYEFVSDAPLIDFPREWYQRLVSAQTNQINNPQAANGDNGASGLFVPPPHTNLIVPDSINQGARNDSLARLAGSLRRIGLNEAEINAALQHLNNRVCKPPLASTEVAEIARKISRYAPHDTIETAETDAGGTDYENTLRPYSLDNFFDIDFGEKEILGFHIGKKDIAVIQAATNAGKTTLLRNVALCMAAGRAFHPFYEGSRPVKIGYFDFENDAQDVQKDLRIMFDVFSDDEKANLKKNFIVVPKGLMAGEMFQFNTHEKWANELIESNKIEFILVDNVSAAYDLNDENSNAEVTKKVIKPLLKMAYKGDCAFLFAHHYGKTKNELESAGVHAGRGASALQALSRTVINMFGDVSKGETVTVECAKRKTDGGRNYREVFRLESDRWFHHTTIVPPPKKKTAYQAIREFMETIVYPAMVSTADVITKFQNDYGVDSIKKAVNELYKDGFVEKPKHGFYCAKDLTGSQQRQSVKVQNFYEKDGEDSEKV